MGHEPLGIEIARQLLVGYRSARPMRGNPVLLADMAGLPFRSETLDAVLLFNQVVGHAATQVDRVATLAESLRVIRRDGIVLLSFYVGAVKDYSLLLGAWSERAVDAAAPDSDASGDPRTSRVGLNRIARRVEDWVDGKSERARRGLRRLLRGNVGRAPGGDDVLLCPSGRAVDGPGPSVPFHLYRLKEFFKDVGEAGGHVLLWRSNAELNGGFTAPMFLRSLDHLHFCALARTAKVSWT